jgi:hypothetical protein
VTETDWQLHADWQLGHVSDQDYADALVRGGVDEDDVIVKMLRERDRPAKPRRTSESSTE